MTMVLRKALLFKIEDFKQQIESNHIFWLRFHLQSCWSSPQTYTGSQGCKAPVTHWAVWPCQLMLGSSSVSWKYFWWLLLLHVVGKWDNNLSAECWAIPGYLNIPAHYLSSQNPAPVIHPSVTDDSERCYHFNTWKNTALSNLCFS